jgi:hypothetical protein
MPRVSIIQVRDAVPSVGPADAACDPILAFEFETKTFDRPLKLRFCDVFVMQAGKIRQLISYLMEVK